MSNNLVPVLNESDTNEYFNSMPPGYRFAPTDEVLILCYLRKKLMNESKTMPTNRIRDVNIYQYHPRDLTAMYELQRDNEWYFFTPISRKYVNSFRPNRPAHNGYWKARMSSPIKDKNNEVVGYRKSMEFYEGIHPNGNKTEWKMMEYTINEALIVPLNNTNAKTCMKLDDYVLCKIFKKSGVKKNDSNDQLELIPIGTFDELYVSPSAYRKEKISMVGPSSTTSTDQLPAHEAMEHETYYNHEVQKHGSSDSKQEEEEEEDDDGWLIIGVEYLNIADPMLG